MPVVLEPVRRDLSARLGSGCDPEGSEPGNEPLHADPHASLTQLPMESYSVFRQPERQGGEPNAIVVLQGE